jgi:hypothetical protein
VLITLHHCCNSLYSPPFHCSLIGYQVSKIMFSNIATVIIWQNYWANDYHFWATWPHCFGQSLANICTYLLMTAVCFKSSTLWTNIVPVTLTLSVFCIQYVLVILATLCTFNLLCFEHSMEPITQNAYMMFM